MKKYKSILSFILSLLIIFFGLSAMSIAYEEYEYDDFTYTVEDGTIKITSYPEKAKGTVNVPAKIDGIAVTAIDNGAFQACTLITKVKIPGTVKTIGNYAFAFCVSLTRVEIPSSVSSIGKNAFKNSGKVVIAGYADSYAESYAKTNGISFEKIKNIYNLGDETYSFENYGDDDSPNGHCFGMAVTSSGYYLNLLNKSIVGKKNTDIVYDFEDSADVKKPICHYLHIQGKGTEYEAIVAGGNYELYGYFDIHSDWNSCVNYVKNHVYDNSGSLNVGMWFDEGGGHAVNFLYYSEVSGQERIYVYDNNFPDIETYYYMGEDGFVHQAPEETTPDGIVGIDLMNVKKYLKLAPNFESYRYIYADKTEISVDGAKMYNMKCGPKQTLYVMYEIPKECKEVSIRPLVDNATFNYVGKSYSFGKVDDKTYGVLSVKTKDSEEGTSTKFDVVNAPVDSKAVSLSNVSLNYKQSKSLNPIINIGETKDYTVKYESSNPSVVTVDENGNVYGAKKGSATIICMVTDKEGNVYSGTCTVKVKYTFLQWIIKILFLGFFWY